MNEDVYAIILAGGRGSRFSSSIKKQFIVFHGKELWCHIYDTASKVIPSQNIVVVGVDIPGGATRSESVKNGLEWINRKGGCRRVICLESARALVTKDQIQRIVEIDSKSCCYVLPVIDTVALLDKTYLNRADCRHIVSPQAFDFNLLYNAYSNCDLSEIRTDDTRLVFETYGIEPDFIEGEQNLFKVTYSKDIVVLENIWHEFFEKGC